MKTIKFRGQTITGEVLYAEPFESLTDFENFCCDVAEETVVQLVGRDKNGREVYEGDKIKNPVDGTTFRAAMNHIYTVKNYEVIA